MRRPFIIIAIVLAIPLLIAATVATILANPEVFRDQLLIAINESSDYLVDIEGDVSWRYWPPIALDIEEVTVRAPDTNTTLMTLKQASIDLDLMPLLQGNQSLGIRGISIRGLILGLVIDKQGKGNWEVGTKKPAPALPSVNSPGSKDGSQVQQSDNRSIDLHISSIDLSDITVDYQDESTGDKYLAHIQSFTANSIEPDTPVNFDVGFRVEDTTNQISMAGTSAGQFDLTGANARLAFANLSLTATTTMPDSPDINITTTLTGEIETAGDTTTLNISALDGTLNSTAFTGSFAAQLAEKTALTFDLVIDDLNANDFLTPKATEPQPAGTKHNNKQGRQSHSTPRPVNAQIEDSEIIPFELLSTTNLSGTVKIARFTINNFHFSEFQLDVQNANKQLRITNQLGGYGGSIRFDLRTQLEGDVSTSLEMKIDNIDIAELTEFEALSGDIDLTSTLTFKGTMMSDLVESLDGLSQFEVTNGTLDVAPIKQVAILVDTIRGKQSTMSQWPDEMPFTTMNGTHRFNKGILADQLLNFNLENLAVDGKGGVDYFANQVTYDLTTTLAESTDSVFNPPSVLRNVGWPIQCKGSLDLPPAELCKPDTRSIKKLVGDIMKQELKKQGQKKLNDVIEEKAPEQIKSLLKGLFR